MQKFTVGLIAGAIEKESLIYANYGVFVYSVDNPFVDSVRMI